MASQIEIVRGGETTVLSVETLPVQTSLEMSEGETALTIKTSIYWCRSGQATLCNYSMETYELTLLAESGGPERIAVSL